MNNNYKDLLIQVTKKKFGIPNMLNQGWVINLDSFGSSSMQSGCFSLKKIKKRELQKHLQQMFTKALIIIIIIIIKIIFSHK